MNTTTMTTPTPRYRVYRWPELAALFVLAVPMWLWPQSGLAAWALLAEIIYALVRDGRGVLSLRGRIPWQRMRGKARAWAIIGYVLLFPLAWLAYIVLAAGETYQWDKGEPERTQARIDALERELGIGQRQEETRQ